MVSGMTYYAPLVSALVTLVLTFILMTGKTGVMVRDIPNERSLHSTPVPRVGGIALMAGVLSGWALLTQFLAWWIVLPVMGLFVLSLLDDMRSLSARTRLIVHFIAALAAVSGAGVPLLWLIPVLLFIVWMTNLYNFMDGSDGLAGGMALFGFGSYGVGAWLGGSEMFALLNFSVATAALGFLFFNFHPARVFMGDAGSIPLGFLAAVFGVSGWQAGYWPFWFLLLVFSPFVADATVTLLKRPRAHRKALPSASQPLLSAPGPDGLGASQYRARGIRVDAAGRRIGRVEHRPGCAGTGRYTGLLVRDLFGVINLARSGLAVVPDKTGEC